MAAATPTGEVRLKRREDWRLIGTAAPRIDAAAKSDGSARFGIDVRPPGLLFAAIRHCPMLGGSPGAVDVAPALALAGVERVVRLGPYAGSTAALAVVGRTSWHAQRGADAIKVEWRQRPAGGLDTRAVMAHLEERARAAATRDGGFAFHSRGDIASADAGAARHVEQTYRAPYLAHATMEPINCTARVAAGKVEVWAPTQVPGLARTIAAEAAGVDEDAVTVHVTYLGGGFGRRLDVDFVGQAVRIARRDRRPAGAARVVARRGPHARLLSPGRGRDPARRPRRRRLAGHAARDERRRRDHAALDRARRPVPRRPGRHARQDDERRPVRPALRRAAPAHRPRRDAERRAGRLLALGRSFAQRVLRRVVRRRARARGRPRPGRLPARAAQGRAAPRRGPAPRRRARRLARPGPLAAARAGTRARRRAARDRSAASSRRSSRRRSRTAGRACIASSAPPTSAPSSTRGSSPSRWKAR